MGEGLKRTKAAARKSRECTLLYFWMGGQKCGELQACDVHGNGRSNKSWTGTVDGEEIDLPNMKAVAAWAKERGLEIERR